MRFKQFYEDYLEEDAIMDISNLGVYDNENDNMLSLYQIDLAKQGLEEMDLEKILSSVVGVLVYNVSPKIKKAVEVYKVHARQGYGPILYLLAMQKAKQHKKGLVPYREPNYVSDEAKVIWRNFYNGKGQHLVKKLPLSERLHTEDYLNYMYTNLKKIDISKNLQITKELLSDDKWGEKKTLFLEAFASYVENEMRELYK